MKDIYTKTNPGMQIFTEPQVAYTKGTPVDTCQYQTMKPIDALFRPIPTSCAVADTQGYLSRQISTAPERPIHFATRVEPHQIPP